MNLVLFLSVLAALFVLIAIGQPLAIRMRLSFAVLMALVGIGIGVGARFLLATPLTDVLNPLALSILQMPIHGEAFVYIFLPTLLFHVALTIDLRRMAKDWVPISVMGVVAVVVATFFIGWALKPFTPQPLVVCLLVGAIVATTDPSAVVGVFRDIGAPGRLTRLVEGESLMNDAAAISLFTLFIGMILPWSSETTYSQQLVRFFVLFVAGALTGYATGLAAVMVMDRLRGQPMALVSLSLALPYLTYILAEHGLHVSGVIGVVAAGMTVNLMGPSRMPPDAWKYLRDIWELLSHWSGALIFILAAIFVPRLLDNVTLSDVALIGVVIVAALAARAVVLFGLLPLLSRLHLSPAVHRNYRMVMVWGGLRGAVTLALALAVTENPLVPSEAKQMVAVLATGFTLFTLIIQGTTLRPVIAYLGLNRLTALEEALQKQVVAVALQTVREEVSETATQHQLTREIVRSEAKAFGERIDSAVVEAEEGTEILERDRLTLSLVTLASREKELVLEGFRNRSISTALMERLLLDADRLIEATRGGGRSAYRATARDNMALGWGPRIAFRLHRRLRLSQFLERIMADRFEVLLTTRMTLRDLHHFVDTKILRIHGRRVADLLHEVLSRREEELDRDLAGLRLQFPGYSEAFERRFIRRAALRFEEREYETAFTDGLIGLELFVSLMRGLDRRRKANLQRPKLDLSLQKQEFVGQVPLFASLTQKQRKRLAHALLPLYAQPGEVLMRRGDPAAAVYFLTSGAVEVDHPGQQKIRLGRGDMFGQMALVSGQRRRNAQVRAITHCALLMLDEAHFRALLHRDPELRAKVREEAIRRGADSTVIARVLGPEDAPPRPEGGEPAPGSGQVGG